MPEDAYIEARSRLCALLVIARFADWKAHAEEAELLSGQFDRSRTEIDPIRLRIVNFRCDLDLLTDDTLRLLSDAQHAKFMRARLTAHKEFSPMAVASPDVRHWANAAFWRVGEAALLLGNLEPTNDARRQVEHFANVDPLAAKIARVLDLLERAAQVAELSHTPAPKEIINWAKKRHIAVPAELEEAVKDAHAEQHDELVPKERTSLLKIIAVQSSLLDEKYKDARGVATSRWLEGQMALKGLRLDERTIRKHLEAAKALQPS